MTPSSRIDGERTLDVGTAVDLWDTAEKLTEV
jgi:hypothetical protein